jgi:hypothetical protein
VVDVIGFNDRTWIGATGTFHTEAIHVTERYTRVDYNRINYDVTVEDPNVLTKPWITHSSIMLRPGTRLRQYECEENNSDIQHYRPTPHGPALTLHRSVSALGREWLSKCYGYSRGETEMLLVLIILLLIFGGGGGYYGYHQWGPGGGLGVVLLVLLLLFLFGRGRISI